jgi:FixJ family two-component response regulator
MDATKPTIWVVDDDPAVLNALRRAFEGEGFQVETWSSAYDFLQQHDPELHGCVIADVAMPGLDGLQLQERLTLEGLARPIVFITGRGSIAMSVRAMKAGAVSFLTKPVRFERLLAEVRLALQVDAAQREAHKQRAEVETRLKSLTPRELEVLELIVAGRMTKQIAGELGAAAATVKVHRGRVMHKMEARTVAELVALAAQAGVKRQTPA